MENNENNNDLQAKMESWKIAADFVDGWDVVSLPDKKTRAIEFAGKVHAFQTRKGKDVPYVRHPLEVMRILERAGADEDTIIAGMLHDTIEDCKPYGSVTRGQLANLFGEKVAELVDSVTEKQKDLPWADRKKEALEHIKSFSNDTVLLKSADVLNNVSEIVTDYNRDGEATFTRFNATKGDLIQNYLHVITALLEQWPLSPLTADLRSIAGSLAKMDTMSIDTLDIQQRFGYIERMTGSDWDGFLNEANDATKKIYEPIIRDFLSLDNIDRMRFLANYRILDNEGRDIYAMSAKLTGDEDLSELGTKSIDALASTIDRPVGYENWFVAGYPDVVLWAAALVKQGNTVVLSQIITSDPAQNSGNIQRTDLRALINEFKKTSDTFECQKDPV